VARAVGAPPRGDGDRHERIEPRQMGRRNRPCAGPRARRAARAWRVLLWTPDGWVRIPDPPDDRRDVLDAEIEHDGGLDEWVRRRAAALGLVPARDLAAALLDAVKAAGDGVRRVETDAMTSDEAVVYLRLPSRKSLYQLVRRGVLRPSRRIGRQMRFSRKALDAFLAGR